MIKANELRIGNWVVFDNDSFPEQMRLESFAVLYKYPERIVSIKPIPLTPEILEKCEMKGDEVEFFGYLNSSTKEVDNRRQVWTKPVTAKPKYLHQLQNLYFALTGNELEINLNP